MILFFVYLIALLWIVGKIPFLRNSMIKPNVLRILFLVKVVFGTVSLFVYSYYYPKETSDIYNYFNDGEILYSSLKESPSDYFSMLTGINDDQPHLNKYYDTMSYWIKPFDYNLYNDNKIVIKLNGFIRLFSCGNIHTHNLFFNLISLIGLIAIFRFLSNGLSYKQLTLLLPIMFFLPTVLFWGSAILKESPTIFALGLLLWSFNYLFNNSKNWKIWILFLISGYLFVHTKIYVVLSVIPGLLWLIVNRFYNKHRFLTFITLHIAVALIAFNIHQIGSNYNVTNLITDKQNDFINMITMMTNAGSSVDLPRLDGSLLAIFKLMPVGFCNALFRPHLFEFHNIMTFAAALENLFIAIFIVLGLVFASYSKKHPPQLYFSLSFSVILLTIIGVATPVLGALVRYKLPALPFIIAIFITTFDTKKYRRIMNSLKLNRIMRFCDMSVEKCKNLIFKNDTIQKHN
ncbi:MAG TPA: hypothetical protein PLY32_05105 [Salinivirgaceae bacterium]|nr:hypothetical protein [Salinivirgaceae bacterium]HQA76479.1 hypothetical protein [Salinivirgaceae bacterium]